MTIWSLLEEALQRHGGRTAVAAAAGPVDYAGLGAAARALAERLLERGLSPGDRVSVLSDNTPGFLAAYFAAAGAGLVLNPLNTRLARPELAEILADCGSSLLLAGPGHGEAARELGLPVLELAADVAPAPEGSGSFRPAPEAPDDPAHLYYTSGTTGRAKGVVLTHANVVHHARLALAELELASDDVWGHYAPLFHLADAWACFAVTLAGGAHAFEPRFVAADVLRSIERRRVTKTNLVPTMIVRLLDELSRGPRDLSSLRLLLSGGAPIPLEVVRAIEEHVGCEYAQTYGMTEATPYLTLSRPDAATAGLPAEELRRLRARTGRPFGDVELEVVDDAGRPVARDDCAVGEVRVRGASVSPGYWRRPEETAAAFRDGWLHTGDLARIDARGWIDIVDRKKDTIVTGGESVYSTEVENALFADPLVLEAAAFGLPDAEWGERVAAAVVLRPGAEPDVEAIVARCRERIAPYKVPREVHVVDELPKTGSGKVHKVALRERFGTGPAPARRGSSEG